MVGFIDMANIKANILQILLLIFILCSKQLWLVFVAADKLGNAASPRSRRAGIFIYVILSLSYLRKIRFERR